MNRELLSAVVKLFVSIIISLILAPMLLIYGANLVLGAMALTLIPYSLGSYFGALLIRIALMVKVED